MCSLAKLMAMWSSHHNRLRDEFCRQAGIGGQMEVGNGLGLDARGTQPADVLVSLLGFRENLQHLT